MPRWCSANSTRVANGQIQCPYSATSERGLAHASHSRQWAPDFEVAGALDAAKGSQVEERFQPGVGEDGRERVRVVGRGRGKVVVEALHQPEPVGHHAGGQFDAAPGERRRAAANETAAAGQTPIAGSSSPLVPSSISGCSASHSFAAATCAEISPRYSSDT